MIGEPSAKQGDAGRGESRSDRTGGFPQREYCGASLTKLCKQQNGEERAALACLRHQGQRRQLRHTVSERNMVRMEGR